MQCKWMSFASKVLSEAVEQTSAPRTATALQISSECTAHKQYIRVLHPIQSQSGYAICTVTRVNDTATEFSTLNKAQVGQRPSVDLNKRSSSWSIRHSAWLSLPTSEQGRYAGMLIVGSVSKTCFDRYTVYFLKRMWSVSNNQDHKDVAQKTMWPTYSTPKHRPGMGGRAQQTQHETVLVKGQGISRSGLAERL